MAAKGELQRKSKGASKASSKRQKVARRERERRSKTQPSRKNARGGTVKECARYAARARNEERQQQARAGECASGGEGVSRGRWRQERRQEAGAGRQERVVVQQEAASASGLRSRRYARREPLKIQSRSSDTTAESFMKKPGPDSASHYP
jgi:hypothetical protein